MVDPRAIIDTLIAEREATQRKWHLLDQAIELIQMEGNNAELLGVLSEFLKVNEGKKTSKQPITLGSKMNLVADLTKKYPGYAEARSLKDKIVSVLKGEGKFLQIREIAVLFTELEFEAKRTVDEWIKNVSPVVSAMAKSADRICKISDESGNKKSTLWGLVEWANNGNRIEDFLIEKGESITNLGRSN